MQPTVDSTETNNYYSYNSTTYDDAVPTAQERHELYEADITDNENNLNNEQGKGRMTTLQRSIIISHDSIV